MYNGTGGGDLSDGKGNTIDSFHESLSPGQIDADSAGDNPLMDVLGDDPNVVPEPPSLALLASAVVMGLNARRFLRRRNGGAA